VLGASCGERSESGWEGGRSLRRDPRLEPTLPVAGPDVTTASDRTSTLRTDRSGRGERKPPA